MSPWRTRDLLETPFHGFKALPTGTSAEIIKKLSFKLARAGELVGREAARRLGIPFGIIDLSLAPTPVPGDSVANIPACVCQQAAPAPAPAPIKVEKETTTPAKSTTVIKTKKDPLGRTLRALFQGHRFFRDNADETIRIAAKGIGWSEQATRRAYGIVRPLLSVDGRFDLEALKFMQDTLLELGVVKHRLPLDQHYTPEFTPVKV